MTVNNGDVLTVVAVQSTGGVGEVLNTFTVACEMTASELDATVMADIATDLNASFAIIAAHQSVSHGYVRIDYYNVTQDKPMGSALWPTLVSGTDAVSELLPPQMAAQVNFPTGIKRSQGRKYLGGFGEAAQTGGGSLSSAALAACQDFGQQFIAAVPITSGTIRFGHFQTGTTVFRPWTSAIAVPLMATQRRRKLGVGA